MYSIDATTATVKGDGMEVRNIDHLNLAVGNFDETAAWYGRVFGFEKVEEGLQDGVRWGVIRAWYIQDPTGYEIEVACWNDDTIRFDEMGTGT